jgi:hypothetical protein
MCIITIAPELGVAMATEQFVRAREMNKKFQKLHFTLTHCFYALMGGFVIAVPRHSGDANATQGHLTSSENRVDIYYLECEDFGKCFITAIVTAKECSGRELLLIMEYRYARGNGFIP